jgi:hypothetical protein
LTLVGAGDIVASMTTRAIPASVLCTLSRLAAVALLSVAGGGCAAKSPAPGPAAAPAAATTDSGFLTDYSRLQASDQSPEVRFFRDDTRKGGYRRLFVRPVAVWRGADAVDDVPEEDLQYVADAFYKSLARRLGAGFELVDASGPGVLEIDIGFTMVPTPDKAIDTFLTRVPVKDLAPRRGDLPDGTRRFLRECLLEVEFRDIPAPAPGAVPAKRPKKAVRAAFVDARTGAGTPKGNVQTWADLDAVFEKWAAALDERLMALRDGNFKPRLTSGGATKTD